jgi:hypothetical protein
MKKFGTNNPYEIKETFQNPIQEEAEEAKGTRKTK